MLKKSVQLLLVMDVLDKLVNEDLFKTLRSSSFGSLVLKILCPERRVRRCGEETRVKVVLNWLGEHFLVSTFEKKNYFSWNFFDLNRVYRCLGNSICKVTFFFNWTENCFVLGHAKIFLFLRTRKCRSRWNLCVCESQIVRSVARGMCGPFVWVRLGNRWETFQEDFWKKFEEWT